MEAGQKEEVWTSVIPYKRTAPRLRGELSHGMARQHTRATACLVRRGEGTTQCGDGRASTGVGCTGLDRVRSRGRAHDPGTARRAGAALPAPHHPRDCGHARDALSLV